MKNQHPIELLAPAGSWEALQAAVSAGADAVYLGGKTFGARAYADNFDREELGRAVRFTHLHRVRLYVTVNTLVDDTEMKDLADYLIFLNNTGVDGIIVQDLGIIRLARALVPGLPLHASTQMTVTGSPAVRFARENGMTRVVPARELSLTDLQAASGENLEIEGFIHGALCVCYSGQCLMSSMIGGRSGNRGRCAQPCRMPYTLVDSDGKNVLAGRGVGPYLLSPRDLNTLDILPSLIESGVYSYKIEGRMKRPEYVAVVVDVYRRAMDSYFAGNYHVPETDRENIKQIFNRGFTTLYLEGKPGKNMMSDGKPNNRGIAIGKVEAYSGRKNKAVIRLDGSLRVGDGIEFPVRGDKESGTTVSDLRVKGRSVHIAKKGDVIEIDAPRNIRTGGTVYRTLDSELMKQAGKFFGDKNKRRIPVTAHVTVSEGQPLALTLTDELGNEVTAYSEFIAEKAENRPMTLDSLRDQLDRFGSTEYSLSGLTADITGEVIIPKSEVNRTRRDAVGLLDNLRLENFALPRDIVDPVMARVTVERQNAAIRRSVCNDRVKELAVRVDTVGKTRAAIDAGADLVIFGGDRFSTKDVSFDDYVTAIDMCREAGVGVAVGTPRIARENNLKYWAGIMRKADAAGADRLYIHNLCLWQLAREEGLKIPLWADYGLNVFNSQSVAFWKENGASGIVPSLELTLNQIKTLLSQSPLPLSFGIHGPVEMMVSEYCAPGAFLGRVDKGKCSHRCSTDLWLKDRKGSGFRVTGDQFCRMHILNSCDLAMNDSLAQLARGGVGRMIIDAKTYSPDETYRLVRNYRSLIASRRDGEKISGTTHGHYFRGVL